jgi:serpin B
MNRRFWITRITLIVFCFLAACQPKSTVLQANKTREIPVVAQGDIKTLVAGNNAFAFDLYQALGKGEDNLLYSPYSLSEVMAMVYAGARGETEQEMANTLHYTLPQEYLHPVINALDLDLRERSAPATLSIANAVWGQKGYAYQPEYLDLLEQNYGAGMRIVDFGAENVANTINRWVSDETKGRITDIVNKVQGPLVLVNAIYFYGEWVKSFDEELTKPEPFYLLDGRTEDAPLMHQTEEFAYTEGEGFQAIQLPYTNRDFAMVILLPAKGQFGEFERQLTNESVQGILQGFRYKGVILAMPKFRIETAVIKLAEILSAMGMSNAFSRSADFSGITQQEPGLVIGEVLHKAFIEVNEKGTEAAAASVVKMTESPVTTTIEMRIDHPFIFFIRDIRTNAILFVGRVTNPVQ